VAAPLRILFVAPAYWPATAFGGPIPVLRELASGLVGRGHRVDVVTTTLEEIGRRPPRRGSTRVVDGANVHYLRTPLRFRWMGIAPGVEAALGRLPRPDVVHVFGYRDYVGTRAAAWCRRHGVPYVFEGLGMVRPKLRKVALKRLLDRTVYRGVLRGVAVAVAASAREREEYLDAGVPAERIAVRPNGVAPAAEPAARPGPLRTRLRLDAATPLVLSVGRIAEGKGLDLLVRGVAELPGVHLAVVGPDDGHGTTQRLDGLRRSLEVAERVHLVGPLPAQELAAGYTEADVFALASAHENFGMVAAEAAAAGVPVVVTDRCGVTEVLRDAAVVVPYEQAAVRDALAALLADPERARALGAAGRHAVAALAWPEVVRRQEEIYRSAAGR
jgi:glycosyltransferase involved in cell wall biosynthesis